MESCKLGAATGLPGWAAHCPIRYWPPSRWLVRGVCAGLTSPKWEGWKAEECPERPNVDERFYSIWGKFQKSQALSSGEQIPPLITKYLVSWCWLCWPSHPPPCIVSTFYQVYFKVWWIIQVSCNGYLRNRILWLYEIS